MGVIPAKAGIQADTECRIKSGMTEFASLMAGLIKSADERLQRRYALKAKGWNLDKLAEKAGAIYSLDPEQVFMPGRQPIKVKARSLFCYWAARELGIATTKLAQLLKISQPAASICVRRGEQIVLKEGYNVLKMKEILI